MGLVMLIEDNDDIRETLAELIADDGYEVITAKHGQHARELLQQSKRPCLVILDLMMPVMDGWALRAWMLAQPEFADIPVIVLTARPNIGEEVEKLKAVAGLSKPVSLERLMEHVAAHC